MADQSLGEPVGQRHGIALWSAQTTMGTPVTPATGIGIGTLRWNEIGDPQYFDGPGSPDPIHMRPGSTYVEWTLDIEALQTGAKTLFIRAQRVSNLVPMTTLGLGTADDDSPVNVQIDQIQDCKIERATIALDVSGGHGPVRASLSGVGTIRTRLTAGAAALLTSTPWMTQDGILTRGGSAFEVRSFTAEIVNTISRDYVIHGSAPTNARIPKYLTEHQRAYTYDLTRYAEHAVALQASTLAEAAMVLTLTNPVDSATLVLTYANATFGNQERSVARDGAFYAASGRARALTIT